MKESLRRRYEELRNKIEKLGEAEAGDASAVEELESRNRELRALNATIEGLQKKVEGTQRTFSKYISLTRTRRE